MARGLLGSMTMLRSFLPSRPRAFSYFCIVAAAAASLATSKPPPDWVIEDTASGEVALTPDQEETVIHLHVSSRMISSSLEMNVALDPVPPIGSDILLVGAPTVVTAGVVSAPTTSWITLPSQYSLRSDGFEQTLGAQIGVDEDKLLDIPIKWNVSSEASVVEADGALDRAPRRSLTIRWRAKLSTEGYDDRPAGSVSVEPAP